MTSVDSGVETGNDSNDGVQLENLSNQSLTKVTAAISSTEKQIATTHKHEPILLGSEALASLTKSPVGSFIMTDYVFSDIQFKSPINSGRAVPEKSDHRAKFISVRPRKTDLFPNGSQTFEDYYQLMRNRRLRIAVITNNVDLVKSELEKGCSPNTSDIRKRTPLHLAACRGFTEIVKLLLDYGANPNEADSLSNTPLHLAAVTCRYDVITLLLEAGANPLSSDRHGYNPLQLAQSKLRLLQSCRGSDVNVVKKEVHVIIKMLLAHLKKQNNANEQIEELSSFCSRISLSNTEDQVQCDLNGLLASIDALSLTT